MRQNDLVIPNRVYDVRFLFRSLPNIASSRIFHQTRLRIMESGSNKESTEYFWQ